MNTRIVGAALITIGLFAIIGFSYAFVSSLTIHNTGSVQMVKAFWDQGLTQEVTTIDWGNLLPDSTQNRTIYVKNFASKTVNLTLTTDNWTPSNTVSYMEVTWDVEGENINGGMTLQATISLYVHADITTTSIGSFSFDLVLPEHWAA